jgi:hypothetical protein
MEDHYTRIVAEERYHQVHEFLRHAQHILPSDHEAHPHIVAALHTVGQCWSDARVTLELLTLPEAMLVDNADLQGA